MSAIAWLLCFSAVLSAVQDVDAAIGIICSTDADCDAANFEFCRKMTDFNPPCSKGQCACKSCYKTVNNTKCVKSTFIRSLNDACTMNAPGEVILPPNADCISSKVQCKQGFTALMSSNSCSFSADKGCTTHADCPAVMVCNSTKCTCRDANQHWDAASQTCIRKRFDDACSSDAQCNSSPAMTPWTDGFPDGLTTQFGDCQAGKCSCNNETSKIVHITFVHPYTAIVLNKTICVDRAVAHGAKQGADCFVNPMNATAGQQGSTCDQGTFCYMCPGEGDADKNMGKCRRPTVDNFELSCADRNVKSVAGSGGAGNGSDKNSSPAPSTASSYQLASSASVALIMMILNR